MVKGKPVDEHAPRRPLSGYFLFAADVRPKIVKAHPDWPVKNVMSDIGAQWNALADAKKKPYQDKAAKASEAYQKKLEKYKTTKHYAKHQEALAEWKKSKNDKPFKKDPNRPKRNLSAYLIFVNEKRPSLEKQGIAFTQITKKAGEMWGNLTAAQKAPYEKKSAKQKADYEKAIAKYEKSKHYKEYMAEKEAWDEKRKAAKKLEKSEKKPKAVAKK